jgi:hypothetical protein
VSAEPTGSVRIRSNVVLDPGRWDLVPGEVLRTARGMRTATELQRGEQMYYEPCSVCSRTIATINLYGCTQCRHAPSPRDTLPAREGHDANLEKARAREAQENAALQQAGVHPDPNSNFEPRGWAD